MIFFLVIQFFYLSSIGVSLKKIEKVSQKFTRKNIKKEIAQILKDIMFATIIKNQICYVHPSYV